MTNQDVNAITSEDYADLIINYSGDENVLNSFLNAVIVKINSVYAMVHIPVQRITNNVIQQFGYGAMPRLFGLVSSASLEASGIRRLRNIPNFNLRGQGVLVGVIDTGIDYMNPAFRNADGTTRIISIWDQSIQSGNPPQREKYGTEYDRNQINQALQSDNPLDIVPSTDTNGHGTMVAGIAGGTESAEHDFFGVAPEAEFVVVKLKPAKKYLKKFLYISEEKLAFQENDILFAIDYVLQTAFALSRPIVICLAVGTSQGAHSGRGVLSGYLSLMTGTPGVATVIAAGNEGNARGHYSGKVNIATGYDVIELNIGENEAGFSMELWGQSPSIFSLDILSPSGEYVPRIAVGMNENREISFVFEQTIINIDYQMVEALTGNQLILMRFDKPAAGIWRFNVYERGDLDLGYHVWLPLREFISENTFFIRSDPYITISAPGNAGTPITTTGYNGADASLYLEAGRGYEVTGVIKPEIAAPAVGVVGPTLSKEFASFQGTSVAAAHTAGVAALIMEWGIIRGNLPGISTVEIKKLMIRGARRNPDISYPNRDWGYGILDLFNVFDSLRTGVVV